MRTSALPSMRLLLSLLVLAGSLSACRLEPPGTADLQAADSILFGPDRASPSRVSLSPDSLALMHARYDRAIAAGHPLALSNKAHAVMMTEGLHASEPLWRRVATDTSLAWPQRDTGYALLASAVSLRPLHERGLEWRDIPYDSVLAYTDAVGSLRVYQEAAAAGSVLADSMLAIQSAALRHQAKAGNADADSILTRLGS